MIEHIAHLKKMYREMSEICHKPNRERHQVRWEVYTQEQESFSGQGDHGIDVHMSSLSAKIYISFYLYHFVCLNTFFFLSW